VNTRRYSHGDRAAFFTQHASNTKSPDTREMYLRLAEVEMALAAQEAALAEQQQSRGEAVARQSPSEPASLRIPALAGASNLAKV
jgi:hypothetical protein